LDLVKIKISRVGSQNGDVPLPQYMTELSSGLDLFASAICLTTMRNLSFRTVLARALSVKTEPPILRRITSNHAFFTLSADPNQRTPRLALGHRALR